MTGSIEPFSDADVTTLEDELRRRFDVEASLRDYLTHQGLLRIPYIGFAVRLPIAEHVAVIAHELFGAVAGERGKMQSLDSLRQTSARYARQNAECKRLRAIEDVGERVREIMQDLRRPGDDPRCISVSIGLDAIEGIGAAALPHLIAALSESIRWSVGSDGSRGHRSGSGGEPGARASHRAPASYAGRGRQSLTPAIPSTRARGTQRRDQSDVADCVPYPPPQS